MTSSRRFLPPPFKVPPGPIRKVLVLAVSPVQALDVTGPLDVFDAANRGAERPVYAPELVSGGPTRRVACSSGLELRARRRFDEVHERIDTLLIAGGAGARGPVHPALLEFLRRQAGRARRYGSVCTGAYLLGAAGLLKRRSVTTHWAWARELSELHPEARVDAEPIWLQDGPLYSSAGVTAGIDLCLSLVADDLGPEIALAIARYLVLYLHRPGGQAQYSVPLAAQQADAPRLALLRTWILANLSGDLSVPTLARRAGASPRNFVRIFSKEFGRPPGEYVRDLRLEAARRKLETSDSSLAEVAAACGIGSAEVLGRLFQARLHVSPGRYRERFRGSGYSSHQVPSARNGPR